MKFSDGGVGDRFFLGKLLGRGWGNLSAILGRKGGDHPQQLDRSLLASGPNRLYARVRSGDGMPFRTQAYGGPKETGIKDLFGSEICTMMSPRGSIVASYENVESFFAMHTPPDHLIRGSYLPSSSYCLRLSPQRVKDLANFILNFFNDLPEIELVCIKFLEDGIEKPLYEFLPHTDTRTWIMFSRLSSCSIPISTILPVQNILEKTAPDRSTAKPTLAQPHHPGCEPPEKQAIKASGWSCIEPRSKAVHKIEEGDRLSMDQRIGLGSET
nr:cytochrome c oxidase subunit 2-1, mitochondrial [Tanacetum cinerariifolium]